MDTTKEAIELIQETAVDAANVSVVTIPGDKETVLLSQGGKYEKHTLPVERRKHVSFDIESLLEVASKYDNHVIWHSEAAIILVLDDDDRRDSVTLTLEKSSVFKIVESLGRSKLNQKQLVRLLKVDLADAVDPTLLSTVRTLNFTKTDSTKSDMQAAASTYGKSVEAKVIGTSDLPDEFLLSTNVYSNVLADQKYPIRISLEVDLEDHTFSLAPIGDQVREVIQATQEKLHDALVAGGATRVLYGRP